MTNIVPKGANRGSAARRKAKHDQRTPLPPRPGQLPAKPDTSKLSPKAAAFANIAAANDWTVAIDVDGVTERLVCTRGDETLHIHWKSETFQQWAGYTYGTGREQRVVNAKSGIRLLERGEKAAADEAGRVATVIRKQTPAVERGEATPPTPPQTFDDKFDRTVEAEGLMVVGLTLDAAKRLKAFFAKDGLTVQIGRS